MCEDKQRIAKGEGEAGRERNEKKKKKQSFVEVGKVLQWTRKRFSSTMQFNNLKILEKCCQD